MSTLKTVLSVLFRLGLAYAFFVMSQMPSPGRSPLKAGIIAGMWMLAGVLQVANMVIDIVRGEV